MSRASHFAFADLDQLRRGMAENVRRHSRPSWRGVDFFERKIRGQEFGHHFFAFDDKASEFLPRFLFSERTQALDLGFGQHEESRDSGVAATSSKLRRG